MKRATLLTAAIDVLASSVTWPARAWRRRRPTAAASRTASATHRLAGLMASPSRHTDVFHGSDLPAVEAALTRILAGTRDHNATDRFGDLPCPPLREGVGHLHDWLASGDCDPTDVLEALQQQAPVTVVADLLRDLQVDLAATNNHELAAQLRQAERLLNQAAELIGEVDYNPASGQDEHSVDCPGGCDGTGEVMQTMTWDDQGEGIYVPVHEELVDCRAGHPEAEHSADCECGGTGYAFRGGYRELCFGRLAHSTDDQVHDGDDPWTGGAPELQPLSLEPPF